MSAMEHAGLLTIDLGALQANWRRLSAGIGSAECGAVVKADAYGLGIEAAVPALIAAGCRTFFVAHVSEGKRVRALDPDVRIYVLNGFPMAAAPAYLELHLSPVLGSVEEARFWAELRAQNPNAPQAALHLETGINRLGLEREEAIGLIKAGTIPHLGLDLILSHFISAEEPDNPLNDRQISDFNALAHQIQAAALTSPQLSLCNSAGIFLPQSPHLDLVRPGYALYGGNPTPGKPNPMQAVIELQAPIMQIKNVKAGLSVGYNGQWIAQRSSRIGVLSIGYADGYLRSASNKPGVTGGAALVAGQLCPFAGRVSMDLITLDLTDVPQNEVHVGDYATLIGPGLDLDTVGLAAGSIGYEILTNLGLRYQRIYRHGMAGYGMAG
jgi:alanine racemase